MQAENEFILMLLLAIDLAFLKRQFDSSLHNRVHWQHERVPELPHDINYVLDQTSSAQGEDVLITITEVSCREETCTWTLQQTMWRLPGSCVGSEGECDGGRIHATTDNINAAKRRDQHCDGGESDENQKPYQAQFPSGW